MTRPVDEILDSILRLYKDNNVVVDKDFIAKKLFTAKEKNNSYTEPL